MKPLMVVGSGDAGYREYALAAMAAHAPLVLLDRREPTWQQRYLRDFQLVEQAGLAGLLDAARDYASRHELGGVATYDERFVEPVAQLAEEFGLPGSGTAAVRACKDKWATRQLLGAAGLGVIRARLVHSGAEALAAAGELGLPVVLKPRSLGGSIGVIRADTLDEVATGYQIAAEAVAPGAVLGHPGVLVEEYIEGPEFSVDAAVSDGVVQPLVLAAKTVGIAPYFEELGHVVDGSAEPPAGLADFLSRVHAALGFRNGVTHTEFKRDAAGFRLIEVNARLGGDLIPYLGLLATGADVAGAVAQLATGQPPTGRADARDSAAIRFVYPRQDITVQQVRIPDDLRQGDGLRAGPLVQPGDVLRLPPGDYMTRAAYLIATGPDAADCTRRLADNIGRIVPVGTPV